jgi:asparagine synthetase B (glutamine-hydrolysing)
MCGIVALYFKGPTAETHSKDLCQSACQQMLETLRFRGPDERSIGDLGGCILGHTVGSTTTHQRTGIGSAASIPRRSSIN